MPCTISVYEKSNGKVSVPNVDAANVGGMMGGTVAEAMGIRVDLAESGPQALDMPARQRPDLIFMGHMMPDMDGFEVTRRIRASPALRDIPVIIVIIVSGNDEARFVEEARQAGAVDAMTKPPATEAPESGRINTELAEAFHYFTRHRTPDRASKRRQDAYFVI